MWQGKVNHWSCGLKPKNFLSYLIFSPTKSTFAEPQHQGFLDSANELQWKTVLRLEQSLYQCSGFQCLGGAHIRPISNPWLLMLGWHWWPGPLSPSGQAAGDVTEQLCSPYSALGTVLSTLQIPSRLIFSGTPRGRLRRLCLYSASRIYRRLERALRGRCSKCFRGTGLPYVILTSTPRGGQCSYHLYLTWGETEVWGDESFSRSPSWWWVALALNPSRLASESSMSLNCPGQQLPFPYCLKIVNFFFFCRPNFKKINIVTLPNLTIVDPQLEPINWIF